MSALVDHEVGRRLAVEGEGSKRKTNAASQWFSSPRTRSTTNMRMSDVPATVYTSCG
jgi:hypothetical protein